MMGVLWHSFRRKIFLTLNSSVCPKYKSAFLRISALQGDLDVSCVFYQVALLSGQVSKSDEEHGYSSQKVYPTARAPDF